MRLEDYIYRHNGGWWFRNSGSTSSGPFMTDTAVIDAFVAWMSPRNPLELARLALEGRAVMEENVHNHGEEFYYSDFETGKCIGPYFTVAEAMKAQEGRALQIHERETMPRRAAG